jgi:replicative DNA helicase
MELSEAQEYTDRSKGLRWRSKALNEYFRDGGVILGDFILIAGFVGCGKSSFIASEVTKMAQQLEGDDYILWMSNEGSYKALIERMYSAALNATSQEMRGDEARQKARASYIKGMKGNLNRIRIIDIQGWNAKQIEQLIAKRTPKLAIIDLVDHIEGFDKYSTKENSFEKYGKLYQWCREVATKYCPVFGISQLNGEGENNMYPMMSQMRGSRVDKQAAASAVLMIGSIVGDNTTRYLSIPKSKINEVSDWTAVVQFDASRSRFI